MGRNSKYITSKKSSIKQYDSNSDLDEVDTFHERRQKIFLDKEEEDNIMEEEMLNLEEEAVMDLDLDDNDQEESSSEEEEEESAVDDKTWGKNKKTYYNTDYMEEEEEDDDNEEEDVADEEEKEVERLQEKKLGVLQAADFLDDDNLGTILAKKAEQRKLKSSTSDNKKLNMDDNYLLESMNKELNGEIIKKDFSTLSKNEKLDILSKESPELLSLLIDFKEKLQEIKEHLQPFMDQMKCGGFDTSNGISFLEVKYHLLMNYCTNILFYLLLKIEGKLVKDHPVIDHLVQLRVIMEKIKPIEHKLRYQIDKLINISTSNYLNEDPLRFKPNPDNLVSKLDENDQDRTNEDDSIYKPPKIAPVIYEDETSMVKQKKKENHLRAKASKSRLLKDLRDEFSMQPEEIMDHNSEDDEDDFSRAKREFEEDHFVRLPVTKKEKAKRKRTQFVNDDFESLNDLGDLTKLDENNTSDMESDIAKIQKKKLLKQYTGDLEKSKREGKTTRTGDTDVPYKSLQKDDKSKKRIDQSTNDNSNHDLTVENNESEDDYYEEMKQLKKKQKNQKNAIHTKIYEGNSSGEEFATHKREAGYSIVKNRGLTAHRKKEDRNPRVKRRKKFEMATKKLKSIKRTMQSSNKPYTGEATGIKTNLSRSVKIGS